MNYLLLTQYEGKIVGPIAWLLGHIINWIFMFLNKIGLPSTGVAIILFTIIINLLLLPLTYKQQKFSKLQAKMNPELQAIQAKYKGKKDNESVYAQQEEIKALYAKYGVSQTGTCLQLLIQFPIMYALLRIINSIPAYVPQIKQAFYPLVSELRETGSKATDLNKYAASRIFTHYEIPTGSFIVIKSGYEYRPEGWGSDLTKATAAKDRPAIVKAQITEVTDKWWGSFEYRAFNISKSGAPALKDDELDALGSVMSIFVPIHKETTDKAMKDAGYDLSKYKKLSLSMAYRSYWNSNTASDLPVQSGSKEDPKMPGSGSKFPTRLFDGNGTAAHYAATRIFKKSEIPNGSIIVAMKGYAYIPDAWIKLDETNDGTERRPKKVVADNADSIVVVDDQWWGEFNFRGFDITEVGVDDKTNFTALQETMLGDGNYSGYPRFCSPKEVGAALVGAGFDVINIANNHSLDLGEEGFLFTRDYLSALAECVIGDKEVRVVERNGMKIAFLAFTYSTNYGLSGVVSRIDEGAIRKAMTEATAKADAVVVSVHWGVEYDTPRYISRYEPTVAQIETAHLLASLGADVIVGTHPHVIERAEWIEENGNRTFCAYSLGNFVSNMRYGATQLGGMLTCDLVKNADGVSVEDPKIVPLVCHYDADHRGHTVYKLSEYTNALASLHGTQNEPNERAFTKEFLIEIYENNIDASFRPENYK